MADQERELSSRGSQLKRGEKFFGIVTSGATCEKEFWRSIFEFDAVPDRVVSKSREAIA
jgi:hypothetical protein